MWGTDADFRILTKITDFTQPSPKVVPVCQNRVWREFRPNKGPVRFVMVDFQDQAGVTISSVSIDMVV